MRRALAAIALALAAAAAAFGQTNAEGAQKELDAGAQAFRERRFAEAERHYRRALELDPEGKNTRLFIARAAQQQYKPDDASPENLAAGERAAAAYQEILSKDPANEDAYKAVVFLYTQMKRDDKVNEFLASRANDFSAPNRQRAEAFTILASKQWQCSYDITEQKDNKTTVNEPNRILIKYKKPANQADFDKAQQCTTEGLKLAEEAASLDPNNPNSWSYKANLLREKMKLAEMTGDTAAKEDFGKQYEAALETQKRLAADAAKQREAEEAAKSPTPPAS